MIWLFTLFACVAEVGDPEVDPAYFDYESDGTGAPGEAMNPFVLPDANGDLVDYRRFLGDELVMDVAGVWCIPCREAAAESVALNAKLSTQGASLATVLVQNVDAGPPSVDDAREWTDVHGLDYPVVADETQLWMDTWRISQWPTWFVMRSDGVISARVDGPASEETLLELASQARD